MIELDVKYQRGHSLSENWIETDYYCPACASGEVWVQDNGGDYYEGPPFLCATCGVSFTMPRCKFVGDDNEQRLAAIRANTA